MEAPVEGSMRSLVQLELAGNLQALVETVFKFQAF